MLQIVDSVEQLEQLDLSNNRWLSCNVQRLLRGKKHIRKLILNYCTRLSFNPDHGNGTCANGINSSSDNSSGNTSSSSSNINNSASNTGDNDSKENTGNNGKNDSSGADVQQEEDVVLLPFPLLSDKKTVIEELHLNRVPQLTNAALQCLLDSIDHVSHLFLFGAKEIDKVPKVINSNAPLDSLVEMNLSMTKINDGSLYILPLHLRKLVCFACSNLKKVEISSLLPHLEYVNFSYCAEMSMLFFHKPVPNLQHVNLSSTRFDEASLLPGEGLLSPIVDSDSSFQQQQVHSKSLFYENHAKQVSQLILSDCQFLTNPAIVLKLLQHLKCLEFCDLTECKSLYPQQVQGNDQKMEDLLDKTWFENFPENSVPVQCNLHLILNDTHASFSGLMNIVKALDTTTIPVNAHVSKPIVLLTRPQPFCSNKQYQQQRSYLYIKGCNFSGDQLALLSEYCNRKNIAIVEQEEDLH